jgi:hypothetical protein
MARRTLGDLHDRPEFLVNLTVGAMLIGCGIAGSGSQTENFNGVDITFSPPNLHEQESFQLRGVLDRDQTEILVSAMPVIAKFLNFARRKDAINFFDKVNEPRKPYAYIEQVDVSLANSRTHHWRVSEDTIQFVEDYLVSYGKVGSARLGDHYFRDAYVFKKVNGRWLFFENFGNAPYGFLKCKHADKACTADVDLW